MAVKTSDVDLPIVMFGEFRVDFHLRCLYRGTEKVKIGPIAFNVLEFLVKNRQRVVSKDELLKNVWGEERTKGTVEQAISQLRRILGDDTAEPQYIGTISGHGYRFIARTTSPLQDSGEEDRETLGSDQAPSAANGISVVTSETVGRQGARSPRLAFICGGAAAVIVGVAAIGATVNFREPQIASVAANGNALVAKDAAGNVLWTHPFEAAFTDRPSEEWVWRTQVVDLNRDGKREVLFAAPLADPQGPHSWREELYCFSSRGKLLWRYRPDIEMGFKGRDFDGPGRIARMIIVEGLPSKSIWLAVDEFEWWPTYLVKLLPDGRAETMFTSAGSIYELGSLHTTSGTYVLAGGVNNEYRMASLAVLAVDAPPSKSPQGEGSEYQCVRGCPSGRPYRYFLLPRSEVNAAHGRPYNDVRKIEARSPRFTVQTRETDQAGQYFDFSEEFQPERVTYSDDFPDLHRLYENERRILHGFDYCPERRNPAKVKIFDENGTSRLVSVPRAQ
jgi:DNA-binding winged helix-turn-helix (wHTH) protein